MIDELHMLVVGHVPEARPMRRHEWAVDLAVDRVKTVSGFERALESDAFELAVSATRLQELRSAEIVRRLKAHDPYKPVIMIGEADEGAALLKACRQGLDDKLIRPDNSRASAQLLRMTIDEHLERYLPGIADSGPRVRVALRRAVYHQVLDSFALLDPDKRILYYNQAADQLARHLLDESLSIGADFVEMYKRRADVDAAEHIETRIDRALQGKPNSLHLEEPAPDGLVEIRQYHFTPVHDHRGRVIAVCLIGRDLRELREVEERLQESESRFWQIFEHLPIGATIVDDEGRFVRVNPAMQELVGYGEEELIGRSPLELTHEEDVAENRAYLDRLLEGEDVIFRLEKRFCHRDGHFVWTDVIGLPVHYDGQQPQRYLGLITDITRERTIEEQLQEAEKMRLVGQIAGGAAHDFNNLLTVITSYTHYVLTELGEDDPTAFALRKVLEAAERGASMTDQLLAFSRHQISQPEPLDLNAVIEDLEEMLQRLVEPRDEIELELFDEPLAVCFDRGQLEQVIFNLVINAHDAMPEGGRISISTARIALDQPREGAFETIEAGRYNQLIVRDTGTGIPPDVLDHIFEPFFTTKEVGQGTGLGLSSSWGLVKQAGGHIDVDTELGRGTTFTVYLPDADTDLDEGSPHPTAAEPRAENATILLVEDQLEVREALRHFLDRQGFRVLEAVDASEALETSQAYADAIDVLLTDVVMPGLDGTELADKLQRDRPNMHVLLMSGYPGERLGELPEDWHLLPKPLDLNALADHLDDILVASS